MQYLAPLADPSLISQTIATALGVRGAPNRSLGESLAEFLRPRDILLILDNCEHVIAECAELVEPLLRAAPQLRVLATSREGLGVSGETVWRVPSLSVPVHPDVLSAEALLECEAVRLFADRAAVVEPTFAIADSNAWTVVEICRRLDGIPLAIELAAARLNVLSVEQISARLKDRFRLLTGGSRTAVARQRTLEATIDWSYELLSEVERTLLCRLSVFPGGLTLASAEEVCAGNGIEKEEILDLLSRLVDKSLINADSDVLDGRRYRCLETVRQYGRDRLVRSGDAERVRNMHLTFFLALALRAEPELRGADQAQWLNRLQNEHGNLRAALEWCLESPEHAETGLELAAAFAWFWTRRAYYAEGRQWLERAIASAPKASAGVRATALGNLGLITFLMGDYVATPTLLDESVSLGREAGDLAVVAMSVGAHAIQSFEAGDFAECARLANDGRASASGKPWFQAPSIVALAYLAMHEGNVSEAIRLTEEGLQLVRPTGDKWALCMQTLDLSFLRLLAGDVGHTETACAEGTALVQELGDRFTTAYFLASLAGVRSAQGHGARAVRLWGSTEGLLERIASLLQRSVKEKRNCSRPSTSSVPSARCRPNTRRRCSSWRGPTRRRIERSNPCLCSRRRSICSNERSAHARSGWPVFAIRPRGRLRRSGATRKRSRSYARRFRSCSTPPVRRTRRPRLFR